MLNQVRNTTRRAAILQANPHQIVKSLNSGKKFEGEQNFNDGNIGQTNDDHREVLVLRYYDELSYAEIAQVLDIKLGTVMSRLSRARQKIQEILPSEFHDRNT